MIQYCVTENYLRHCSDYLLFIDYKTYRPMLSEGTLSRSILHNYTARDSSSGKHTVYKVIPNAVTAA